MGESERKWRECGRKVHGERRVVVKLCREGEKERERGGGREKSGGLWRWGGSLLVRRPVWSSGNEGENFVARECVTL